MNEDLGKRQRRERIGGAKGKEEIKTKEREIEKKIGVAGGKILKKANGVKTEEKAKDK